MNYKTSLTSCVTVSCTRKPRILDVS